MLKIENTNTYGWEAAIRGLRNPMNSWNKSDTAFHYVHGSMTDFTLGEKDLDLMMRMNKHSEESKYRRMITVTMDVIAPLYWWKEFDTYKVGTVCNSCSTMHKIHSKEFTLDDFSHEHLRVAALSVLKNTIEALNAEREAFLGDCLDVLKGDKQCWYSMIQLLPTSYNQRRTIQLNYEVLAQIYRQRRYHKLDEWHTFCDWIGILPYSKLITGEENDRV